LTTIRKSNCLMFCSIFLLFSLITVLPIAECMLNLKNSTELYPRHLSMSNKFRKQLLIAAGTISTVIGILGIIIPILPTTPFLLLAAACYIRSSERFYRWLINNRLLGTYIRNYIEGRGMPLRIKVVTISLLWITIGTSICIATQSLGLRIVLMLVAIGVTLHIIFIRPKRED